ncbi:hypothetical protein [Candidatus Thiosymbion oneisti]|uniref:hypothetical protein n=1 Tax=Candidatus Thiosymbion oneisti TaxID=589554 RepID=UPI00105BD385|nr:hypothetical protein [Candidatus Thiosymbion oneisti]
MFGRFIKNYGKGKLTDAVGGLRDAIVGFDPEGATEAEIATMEENFDKVNREFSKAKQDWLREKKEADTIEDLYQQRLAAAEHIQQQLDAQPDNADQLNAALSQLVETLESMASEVQREKEEAEDAKEVMDDLEATVKLYAENLRTARSQLKAAARTMEKAKRDEERAAVKAERAARLAGLKQNSSILGSALESMNKQAAEAQARADAAKHKAELLGPTKVEDNAIVKQALASVSGVSPTPSSISERLAALKKQS